MIADFVVTDNRRPQHRQRGAQQIAPAQFPSAEQIVDQRDIQRGKHGKQQEFRDRQIEISAEGQQVHDAKLHRAHQHIEHDRARRLASRAQERQEHQRRQAHAHQYRKIAVDATGQVLANQAKRKGPQDSGDN